MSPEAQEAFGTRLAIIMAKAVLEESATVARSEVLKHRNEYEAWEASTRHTFK